MTDGSFNVGPNCDVYTGWGKITSVNCKVNNKNTIRDKKNFIFGF